jgi:uncharacterized membrane protein YozB (DUF420 family)
MEAKVFYWTGAFVNMGFVVGLALAGMAQLKAGRPKRHRLMMISAALLVVGFVVSYGFKLHFLGREDLTVWSSSAIWTLRFHETCVLVMIVAGCLGLNWGRQLRKTRSFSHSPDDPLATDGLRARHIRAGRAALGGAVFGFISSGFVLAGMYARLPS